MKKEEPEIIFNEFIRVLDTWIPVHDQELHFKDNTKPQIKVDGKTRTIRANQEFKKLSKDIQECFVAHELGHLNQPATSDIPNPLYRMGQVLDNKVDQKELDADNFAANKIGYKQYIDALNKILSTWIEDGNYSELAIKELKLRIKALKERN